MTPTSNSDYDLYCSGLEGTGRLIADLYNHTKTAGVPASLGSLDAAGAGIGQFGLYGGDLGVARQQTPHVAAFARLPAGRGFWEDFRPPG